MKLVLLGTTGYHPSAGRHTACFMLPELGLVFDAGTAMFRVRDYLCTQELDIFLSHAHLDHIIGLTFLFDVLGGKKMDRVTVHARTQDIQAIDEHLLAPALFPVKLRCEYQAYGDGPIPVGAGGTLTHFPLEHPGGSVGFRIDWPGKSLAYVTDTIATVDAEYLKHIQGVDLLVHECYFRDEMAEWATTTGHSCTTNVALVAKQANVKRLLLVHVNPLGPEEDPIGLDVAQAVFPQTILAHDLMTIEF